jgi:GH25 family lysozyme M1 (1,4-beta-N-acetylmuramidase)
MTGLKTPMTDESKAGRSALFSSGVQSSPMSARALRRSAAKAARCAGAFLLAVTIALFAPVAAMATEAPGESGANAIMAADKDAAAEAAALEAAAEAAAASDAAASGAAIAAGDDAAVGGAVADDDDALDTAGGAAADAAGAEGVSALAMVTNLNGLYTIRSARSADARGFVADVEGASAANGAKIQLWQENNTLAQRFRFEFVDGYYVITNVGSGKELDVAYAKTENGTAVWQYAANGSDAQKWQVSTVGQEANVVYITSKLRSDLVLTIGSPDSLQGAALSVTRIVSGIPDSARFVVDPVSRTVADGTYVISSAVGAGKVIDVASGSSDPGANIQIWDANGTLAQKWVLKYDTATGYYSMLGGGSALMMDVANASSESGANVQGYGENKTAAQQWSISVDAQNPGTFVIRTACGGNALDLAGASAENGSNIQVWADNGTAAQRWVLSQTELVGVGNYVINSVLGNVIDAENNGTTDRTNVQTWAANRTIAQMWQMQAEGNGLYRFSCMNSGKVLDAAGGSGPNVWLYAWNGSAAQLWSLVPAGHNTFYIMNEATKKVLDVANASKQSGANVQVFTSNKTDAQRWYFTYAELLDGIDVSSHQPENIGYLVDYDFMIVKATEGDYYRNPNFKAQAGAALARGKKLGIYHYAGEYDFADPEAEVPDPVVEAQFFITTVGQDYINKAIFILDYEGSALHNGREWVRAFQNEVKRLTGVSCGVYCSASPAADQLIPQLCSEQGALFWNANYRYGDMTMYGYRHDIIPDLPCQIYQYTSVGRLAGYSGNLDMDLFYGTIYDWDYWATH